TVLPADKVALAATKAKFEALLE
ncbi:hypothetical protein LCGC14_2207380, partial [marine sediment metagenome]